jgi:hypothetical protein
VIQEDEKILQSGEGKEDHDRNEQKEWDEGREREREEREEQDEGEKSGELQSAHCKRSYTDFLFLAAFSF